MCQIYRTGDVHEIQHFLRLVPTIQPGIDDKEMDSRKASPISKLHTEVVFDGNWRIWWEA